MNRRERRRAAHAQAGADPAAVMERALADQRAGRLDAAERAYRRLLSKFPKHPDVQHWLGVLEHQRGRNDRAISLLRDSARQRPDDVQRLHHLGEACRAAGRLSEAMEAYRKALALAPDMADLHFGLGTALLAVRQPQEAAAALRRAVALAPQDSEARNNLGNALSELGELEGAIAAYREALRLAPGYVEARINLALTLARTGNAPDARTLLRQAVAADPSHAEAWWQLAKLLQRMNRHGEAAEAYAAYLDLNPGDVDARIGLARAWIAAGRPRSAIEALQAALARKADHATAHSLTGQCLTQLGDAEAALSHHERAVRLEPDNAEVQFQLGICLEALGRFDEAADAHERAIALRPAFGVAHYNLAMIRAKSAPAEHAARLQELLGRDDLGDNDRINIAFALGRLLDAQGDYDAAFARYKEANSLRFAQQPFNAQGHRELIERIIATCDAAFFSERRGHGAESRRPVFIVGMPRSGSTLVEQILASHRDMHGAGELNHFRDVVQGLQDFLSTETTYPECLREIGADHARALADDYLAELARHDDSAARVADKMLGNYMRLGLIAQLFPNALVVHCRRNPIDTCLSCYFQHFDRGLRFTYDLESLGIAYRAYRRLMAHWREVLPMRLFEVDYETLVAEPEPIVRDLLEACGLDWDPGCLAFHDTARPVSTASVWQVRQPLYRSSVERWRRYEKHLAPLIEALGDDLAPGAAAS